MGSFIEKLKGSFLGKLEEENFLEKLERGYSHPSNS